MSKFLMVPPNHYRIDYSINPWMKPERWTDYDRLLAYKQWQTLYDKMLELGAEIHLVNQVPEHPDMVFTANSGFVFRDRVYMSTFKHKERVGEKKYFRDAFENLKELNIIDMIEDPFPTMAFEGAGDAIYDQYRKCIWAGHGFRSDMSSSQALFNIVGQQVITLKLCLPQFYHLDTCFAVLPCGEVVYYPNAFNDEGVCQIISKVSKRIVVEQEEAYQFGANLVVINDDDIILGAHCPTLKHDLESYGYTIHTVDLSMFHKAGGSAACLTLRLDLN